VKRAAALAGVALFALAGCSSQAPGQASPEPSSVPASQPAPSSAADQLPGPGVPKVENPIDTTQVAKNPCMVLTDEQVQLVFGYAVQASPRPDGAAGPACSWDGDAAHGYPRVGVVVTNADKRGLTSVYAAKGTGYKFFQPLTPVSGYPAAAYDVSADRRPGECNMAIGVSDTQVIDLEVMQPKARIGSKDPCESGRQVAAMMIGNLQGGH